MAAQLFYRHFKERIEELASSLDDCRLDGLFNGPSFLLLNNMNEIATKIRALRIEVDNHPELSKRHKAKLQNTIDLTGATCEFDQCGMKLRLPGHNDAALLMQRLRADIESDRLVREDLQLQKKRCVIL